MSSRIMAYDSDNDPTGATAHYLTRKMAANIMIVGHLHRTMPGIDPATLAWRQSLGNALAYLTLFYLNND